MKRETRIDVVLEGFRKRDAERVVFDQAQPPSPTHENYCAIGSAQFGELISRGITSGNYSEDGTFVICRKLKGGDYSWVTPIARPNDISAEDAPNWPDDLTHAEAKKAKRIWKLDDV